MSSRGYLVGIVGASLALLTLAGTGAWALAGWHHDIVMGLMLLGALLYAATAAYVRGFEAVFDVAVQRRALMILLVAAAGARLVLIAAPTVSTDVNRYVWDGEVAAAGINPYRYRPADPELAFLRDTVIYPHINRAATATTIYPPLAQLVFLGVTRLSSTVPAMKAAMVGFEALGVIALLALLRRRGLPATRIVFYVFHPLPLFEFAGSGHIDAAAIALMLVACLAAERRQPWLAGALLGAAALAKFFPAVIAPALYRRWDWRFPIAFVAVAVALYLPYLSVGWQVLGFLPGYVQEEGLASGGGYFLLNLLGALRPLPAWATLLYLGAGVAVLLGLGARVVLRGDRREIPLQAALALLTVFTLVLSPHLAWYFTWIIPFFCFRPTWSLIYLTAAAPLLYGIIWSPGQLTLHAAVYLPFAVLFVIEMWCRQRSSALENLNDGRLGPRHAG